MTKHCWVSLKKKLMRDHSSHGHGIGTLMSKLYLSFLVLTNPNCQNILKMLWYVICYCLRICVWKRLNNRLMNKTSSGSDSDALSPLSSPGSRQSIASLKRECCRNSEENIHIYGSIWLCIHMMAAIPFENVWMLQSSYPVETERQTNTKNK